MSRDIKTIAPDADLAAARNTMRINRIRHLIVTAGREIVGIVSDRDLAGRSAGAVADAMTRGVVTAAPQTTVRQAANLLRGHIIGCLVVLQGTTPVGIVTTTDLLDLIGRGAERPIERSTRWTLRGRGPRDARPATRHSRRS